MLSYMLPCRVPTRKRALVSPRLVAPNQDRSELSMCLGGCTFRDGLGKGAYGSVFLAEAPSSSTRKFVAVKVVRRSRLTTQRSLDLLVTEVNCLKQLTATGSMFFTQLYESFCDGHNFYIVTDYLRGGTLREEIVTWGSRIKADRVLFVMAQLVEALSQLRNARIIHRDLKPENILVDALGNITIGDFGMARRFGAQELLAEPVGRRGLRTAAIDSPMIRSTCGTVGYVAPEVHRGEYYSFEVDIYSAGVIFYELLFGRRPFPQRDLRELTLAVCDGDWYVPTGFDVDRTAKHLLRRLLDLYPDDRIGLDAIRTHPFFSTVDWSAIAARTYRLPSHHAPFLRPTTKVAEIDKNILLDPTAVVPDEWDASVHPVVGGIDAVFTVKPSRKVVSRPANPRSWRSRMSRVVSRVAIGLVDAVLSACLDRATGRAGGSRRKDWPSLGKAFVTNKKADAPTTVATPLNVREEQAVERVEVGECHAGVGFSAFACSIVPVEEYVPTVVQEPVSPASRIPPRPQIDMLPEPQPESIPSDVRPDARPAVRPNTRRAATYPMAASVVKSKRARPNLPRISTALPVCRPSMSSPTSPSASNVSLALTRALEEALQGLTPRARDVVQIVPSLAVSRSTLAPTTGPVTPIRASSCGPSEGKAAGGGLGLDLEDVNARVQV